MLISILIQILPQKHSHWKQLVVSLSVYRCVQWLEKSRSNHLPELKWNNCHWIKKQSIILWDTSTFSYIWRTHIFWNIFSVETKLRLNFPFYRSLRKSRTTQLLKTTSAKLCTMAWKINFYIVRKDHVSLKIYFTFTHYVFAFLDFFCDCIQEPYEGTLRKTLRCLKHNGESYEDSQFLSLPISINAGLGVVFSMVRMILLHSLICSSNMSHIWTPLREYCRCRLTVLKPFFKQKGLMWTTGCTAMTVMRKQTWKLWVHLIASYFMKM